MVGRSLEKAKLHKSRLCQKSTARHTIPVVGVTFGICKSMFPRNFVDVCADEVEKCSPNCVCLSWILQHSNNGRKNFSDANPSQRGSTTSRHCNVWYGFYHGMVHHHDQRDMFRMPSSPCDLSWDRPCWDVHGRVITPLVRVITSVTHLFSAIYSCSHLAIYRVLEVESTHHIRFRRTTQDKKTSVYMLAFPIKKKSTPWKSKTKQRMGF